MAKGNIVATGGAMKLKTMEYVRAALSAYLGKTHGGERDLYTQFGWSKVVSAEQLFAMYTRNGLANRIVRSFPSATWREVPTISDEAGDSGDIDSDSYSPFVEAVDALFKKHRVIHYLERADRLASIGRYGVLMMGFRDGQTDLMKPLENGNHPLLYLQPYTETQSKITNWDQNIASPRFGKPESYTLQSGTINGERSSQIRSLPVHHSRLIHLTEFLDEDNNYATPRLLPVFNYLQDLDKITGSGAETFWLNARPGLALSADAESSFSDEMLQDMKEQTKDYEHQLRRVIAMQGVSVTQLAAAIADPGPNIDRLLDIIAGTVKIPKRILVGSERGELSSSQDENHWNGTIGERRTHFAAPAIVVPFIQKMIDTGNLPEPKGKWTVEWSKEETLGPEAAANVAMTKSNTLRNYVTSPGAELLVPPEEFRVEFMGLEAESPYALSDDALFDLEDEAPLPGEEPPLPEDDEAVLDTFKHMKTNARPRPLYIRRDVENAQEIIDWAKSQGFDTTLPADQLHVTVAYNKAPVDWMKLPQAWGIAGEKGVEIIGGPRVIEEFNEGAIVLCFQSEVLKWRHSDLHNSPGMSWSHPDYQPHITITYAKGDVDIDAIEPYTGNIILSDEIFEEIESDWKAELVENAEQPREEDGKFGETPGGDDDSGGDQYESDPGLYDYEENRPAHDRIASASVKNLSQSEAEAVQQYTGDGYKSMNSSLRGSGKMSPADAKASKAMDAMFERTSLSEDVQAFRSVDKATFDSMVKSAGKSFTDKGYVSTTADPEFEFGEGYAVQVRIPKGSKALPIAHLSVNSSESEILINRGSKFKVDVKGKGPDTRVILTLQ